MKWFLQAPLEIIATIVAYITNPIVCLFADEYGNLPKCLYWWQTYDNNLDVDWMVYEHCVPEWAEYDFNKHYTYHLEQKQSDGTVIPGYVDILDDDFTIKERVQRYVCRLCWLYRNCNYGFSYYVNGVETDPSNLKIIKDISETNNKQSICYETGKSLWNAAWKIYYCKQCCSKFRLRIYLGWKISTSKKGRHMLALYINPFKPLE